MGRAAGLHADIHKLIGSQALSKLGDHFTEVALPLFVLAMTHDNVVAVGLIMAMAFVPRVALGWAVAGVIDRLNKRYALLTSDIVSAVLVASIPIVHDFAWTVAAVFLMYTGSMIYRPLVRAIQPEIAGDPQINIASAARQQRYFAVAQTGGYIAAGGLFLLWGVAPAFWIDAATYLTAAVFIASIRVTPDVWKPISGQPENFWRQIGDGYRYLAEASLVAQLAILSALVALAVGSLNTLLAPMPRYVWHVSSERYVWLVLALAVGNSISSTVLDRNKLMERYPLRRLLAVGFALTAVGFGLILATGLWWAGAITLIVAGLGNALYQTALMVWVQQATPVAFRARVLSIRGVGMGLGGAIGAYGAGWAARAMGLPTVVVIVTALWMILALWVWFSKSMGQSAQNDSAA